MPDGATAVIGTEAQDAGALIGLTRQMSCHTRCAGAGESGQRGSAHQRRAVARNRCDRL